MIERVTARTISRRDLLRGGVVLAGGALVAPMLPPWVTGSAGSQQAGAAVDPLARMRADMGAAPIQTTRLTDALTMLSGPGGNVVVLHGPDGKVVVDTFVQPAWDGLKQTIDGLGNARVTVLIDTHWHFDHTDNNAQFRKAGAAVVAHENTKARMSQAHELLGMKFPPSPPEALPTQTFKDRHTLEANGEQMSLDYVPPAHTDTDITVWYSKGNVLHMGDLFFNGMYPFIDASTGGRINGMIAAADAALKIADDRTRIVPGHGPLADKAALMKSRDMLATVRDRVQKLKQSGRTRDEVVAANPTADLDPIWGKGFMQPKDFVAIVYNTI